MKIENLKKETNDLNYGDLIELEEELFLIVHTDDLIYECGLLNVENCRIDSSYSSTDSLPTETILRAKAEDIKLRVK